MARATRMVCRRRIAVGFRIPAGMGLNVAHLAPTESYPLLAGRVPSLPQVALPRSLLLALLKAHPHRCSHGREAKARRCEEQDIDPPRPARACQGRPVNCAVHLPNSPKLQVSKINIVYSAVQYSIYSILAGSLSHYASVSSRC